MTALDWALLAVLVGSALVGAWRGLVFELLSLASWGVAFITARLWGVQVGQWLPLHGWDVGVRAGIGFAATFVAAVFALGVSIALVGKLVSAVGLRPFDRVLGGVFGIIRGCLLVVLIALVFVLTPMRESQIWNTSALAPYLAVALTRLQPWTPQEMEDLWSSLASRFEKVGSP